MDNFFRFALSNDSIDGFVVSENYQEKCRNKDMKVQKQSPGEVL